MNTLNHLLLVHECAKYNFLHFQRRLVHGVKFIINILPINQAKPVLHKTMNCF